MNDFIKRIPGYLWSLIALFLGIIIGAGYGDSLIIVSSTTHSVLKGFIKNRIISSLEQIGFKAPFEIDNDALEATMWFEEELMGNNMADFFHTRPTEYSKKNQSFDEDDLF